MTTQLRVRVPGVIGFGALNDLNTLPPHFGSGLDQFGSQNYNPPMSLLPKSYAVEFY